MSVMASRAPPAEVLNGTSSPISMTKPRLEIVEQPKSRGFRFRYDCEGQSHGGLPGENSEKNRKQKTYPTVRLVRYRGRARVMVSLVSDTDPPVPHAHSIVGKNADDGRCLVEIGPETDMYAQFPNLGILHVTKKKVPDVLLQRLMQQVQMSETSLEHLDDPPSLTEDQMAHLKEQAAKYAKTMNLSIVRLCFQAFLMDEHGRFTIPVDPVFSNKVYDSKAPSAGTLKICRLDRTSGSVRGGDDIFLLCDKVQKNDIEVILYEEKFDSTLNPVHPWTAKGRFGPNDVHHQFAIVFSTPPYFNLAIERPVQVYIALRRPSDSETSEPKPFMYLPQEFDEERIGAKRKKKLQHFNNFFGDGGGAGGAGGGIGRTFFSGLGDVGGFGGSFGGLFGGGSSSGGSGGGGGGGGYSSGGTTNAAGFDPSVPAFDSLPDIFSSNPSFSGSNPQVDNFSNLSLSNPTFSNEQTFQQFDSGAGQPYGQPLPPYSYQPQPNSAGFPPHPSNASPFPLQPQQMFPGQRGYLTGRGPRERASQNGGVPRTVGRPAVEVKRERMDPGYGDVEVDGFSRQPGGRGHSTAQRSDIPPHVQGSTLGVPMDTENEESGIAECSDQQDSGLPRDGASSQAAEVEAQAAMQALKDRQQQAFNVCERMFNALLAWATTKDVRYLLAAQRSLTAVQNQEGDTALHLAIIHNQQDVVLQLLDVLPQLPPTETPCTDCLNNFKQSPLHLAVLTRQHKVMQYLLKANANPLVCDREGNTPLHLACKMGFVEGAVTLVNRTNHINAEGCRIPEVSVRNSSGQTPLHLAALCNNQEVMKLLVNAKADVDIQDSKSGKTALHYSVERGDLPMTGYLVTGTEANSNCCDFSGNTPLHIGAGQGRSAIVSLLIAAGANVGVQNQEGESPLTMAEYASQEEVVKLLKQAMQQAGIPINKPEDDITSAMESVQIKTEVEGDLDCLDFRARISLSMLLDPANDGADWRELCKHLQLENLAAGLQNMTSPTKEMLGMYEACGGSISGLRQALVAINRTDAVNIVDRAIKEDQSEPTLTMVAARHSSRKVRTAPVFSTPESSIPRSMIDSGIGSHSGSEDLGGHFGTPLPPSAEAQPPSLATTHA